MIDYLIRTGAPVDEAPADPQAPRQVPTIAAEAGLPPLAIDAEASVVSDGIAAPAAAPDATAPPAPPATS